MRERIFDAMADEDEKFAVDNKKPTASGAPDGRAKSKANMMKLVDQKFGPQASKTKEKRK